MENYNTSYSNTNIGQTQDNTKSLMAAVFSWMALALVITTVCSLLFAYVPTLTSYLLEDVGNGIIKPTVLAYVVIFAPLIFVFAMRLGFEKFSFPILLILFIAYSAVTGISFSFIFMVYNIGSIQRFFFQVLVCLRCLQLLVTQQKQI